MKQWLYLHVWCRFLYRPVMILAHRYHWHYLPPMPRMADQPEGETDHWCRWCGLRVTIRDWTEDWKRLL